MSKLVLTYFPGRGAAELSRLIFAEKGVEYVDNRVSDHTSLKVSLPFGQLPLLEVDGLRLAQSLTIARYLARKYDLYGKTLEEGALADMFVDGIADLNAARGSAQTDEAKAKFVSEVLPKWLGLFEKIIEKNGGDYVVGHTFTYADIQLVNAVDTLGFSYPNFKPIDHYPKIKAIFERVSTRPGIANWRATRPQTAN